MEVLFFVFLAAACAGIVASWKNRSGVGWFLLSIFMLGVFGLILVALLPRLPTMAEKRASAEAERIAAIARVPCPSCKEMIVKGAIVCRFCGKDVHAARHAIGPVDVFLAGKAEKF